MERPGRPDSTRDAELVVAVREGRRDAFAQLVETWFDRCWEVSWRILHDRDRAAEVTQDVMLAAWQKLDTLSNPGSFGGWVLRMSRNRSLDRLAHEQRMLPTDEEWMLEPRDPGTALGDPEQEAVRRETHDLVWDAAAALGERDASILDLHLRHGLEARELAGELGIEPNAANQALHRMRGRLGNAIRARMLWRDGDPACDVLGDELSRSKAKEFGPNLVRLIDRHVKDCDPCAQRQRLAGSAVVLFAAVPFVAASPLLRATSAQALSASGVPTPAAWAAEAAAPVGDGAAGFDDATSAHAGAPIPEDTGFVAGGATSEATVSIAAAAQGPHDTGTAPLAPPGGRLLSRRTLTALLIFLGALLLAGGVTVIAVALNPAPTPTETTSPSPSVTPSATSSPSPSPTPTPTPTPTQTPSPPPPSAPSTRPSEPAPVDPAPTATVSAVWAGVRGCPPETPFLYRIRWSTTDADQAVLSGTWGADEVTPAGEAERCGAQTAQFTLTAAGPGGKVVEVVEAEATPAP